MFIESTGFTAPVCYYPTVEVDDIALYHKFWDVVYDLGEFGFKVIVGICDGTQANHTFIQLHFCDMVDLLKQLHFTMTNIYTGEPLILMVDPSVIPYKLYIHALLYFNDAT
jgi:hypothetical protein